MLKDTIGDYLLDTFDDVVALPSWGEDAFFFNPGRVRPRGVYFATLKEKDGANDRASALDRHGVYRLNIGLTKEDYRALFGDPPARPGKGGIVRTGHDFTAIDVLTPHPVYGWMTWVSILNPSAESFERLKPLLANAYRNACATFGKTA